jgi:peptidoglycan/LPS O-acetylase OafA/YrhL
MGTFRTILALLVVCVHLRPIGGPGLHIVSHGAIFAVKAFFIVSGFYMAMVLHGQYRDRPVRDFYLSRGTRLLPLYWLVGALTIAAEYLLVAPGQRFYPLASPRAYGAGLEPGSLPLPILLYAATSVLTMIGLDTGMWLGFGKVGGALGLHPDYVPAATSVMALSPIPQAWTIGVELTFYLVAPFIVGRSLWTIAMLALASLVFRFGMAHLGFDGEPWSRSLFPSELVFFLMGVAAFRLYLRLPTLTNPYINLWRVAPITVALLISPVLSRQPNVLLADTVPYVLVAIGIPFLFNSTKSSALDARIGGLSYPIYIGHMFIMGAVQLIIPQAVLMPLGSGWAWLAANIVCVVAFAFALDTLVAAPIDRWRRRFGARTRGRMTAPAPSQTAYAV